MGINPEVRTAASSPQRSWQICRYAGMQILVGDFHKSFQLDSRQEEDRLVLKGEQERVRLEARERREQLREAQKLQAEQEHLLRLQRRAMDRETQKQRLEAERFEQWRGRLERRDVHRAKLWEKATGRGNDGIKGRPRGPREQDTRNQEGRERRRQRKTRGDEATCFR
ncbi:unnamed protein product [Effrenium voratum]|nr:unnamed protein product [Effrenium voratum]